MKEAKHTPGPWEVELIVGLPRVISDSRKSMCRVIADIHIQEGIGAISNGKNPALVSELAANARLIAAAPDLLEALRWALGTLNCEPYEWTTQEDSEAHEKALAVCAKAEGRDQ